MQGKLEGKRWALSDASDNMCQLLRVVDKSQHPGMGIGAGEEGCGRQTFGWRSAERSD